MALTLGATPTFEQEELRGVSRTVAEIEWLLLILVLLYLTTDGPIPSERPAVQLALFLYGAFILAFHYANFYKSESRWKIAIETWAMTAFITWVVWFTGKLASPILNGYTLVVITSALTLGKLITLAEVGLIAACYLLLSQATLSVDTFFSAPFIAGLCIQLAPLVLVAYVTTMLSADMRYGLSRAKFLSQTDELTGLLNLRGFTTMADRSFAQSARYKHPLSLIMIDSDNLKPVNDKHGHEAGNQLLRYLSRSIVAELRTTDTAARYGGDEFVVMLPETGPDGALDVAERIRESIASRPLEVEGHRLRVTVSIGVASFPGDSSTMEGVLSRADRAMYVAKQSGRNKVVRFQPDAGDAVEELPARG